MTIQLPSVSPGLQQEKKRFPKNHLQTLLDGFCDFSGDEKSGLVFKGLSLNSKKVHEEFLFLACAGSLVNSGEAIQSQHGIAYAGDAINRGASCILWEPTEEIDTMPASCAVKNKPDVPMLPVESLHEKAGEIAARFYGHPSRAVNMIGITGTNGKTSTAHFIAQLYHRLSAGLAGEGNTEGNTTAVIGTLGNGFYGQLETSSHTTPDAVTLQGLIAEFRDNQAKTVVMEVSSHALAQGRVNSVEFDTAIFTNLTRDHLDYHGNMERYAEEKLKLFQCPGLRKIIVNHDDPFSHNIIHWLETQKDNENDKVKADLLSYSRKESSANYFAKEIKLDHSGISFTLCLNLQGHSEKTYTVNTPMVGDFNVENLLAAIAVLHQHDYDMETIVAAVKELNTVPGRMEQVSNTIEREQQTGALPLVIVDYAHTPDALEKVLKALRAHTQGKLICVFGCGGDRDKGKRPLMASIAEQYSDQVMVTSDNPRTEPAEQIIAEIMTGFNSTDKIVSEIDRKSAIETVLREADAMDVILIAGKGHEDYQEINGQRFPFSDVACVNAFYSNRKDH
jgi:UDP-N-acetylmuramoyl-L-alanyl-D-glutamate--2,6-diaminopimelate ligase